MRRRWVVYGVPGLSADVDVTLALVPDAPEHFARDMQAAGFSLRVSDPDFVRRTRVMPFVHEATGMPLDVVLAGSGLEDEFLQRAIPTDIGGTRVPVIEPSDLIIAKVTSPVVSPDGRFVASYSAADSTLKELDLAGGAPVTITPAAAPLGMSWDDQGLVFSVPDKGILRVSPDGGVPEVMVPSSPDETLAHPQILPGGRRCSSR